MQAKVVAPPLWVAVVSIVLGTCVGADMPRGGRLGFQVMQAANYRPDDGRDHTLAGIVWTTDYENVWWHAAPDNLAFRTEFWLGGSSSDQTSAVAAVEFIAQYYLEQFDFGPVRPYLQGGIGVIYTDYRVDGQGLRFNFNPQAGLGAEFDAGRATWFVDVRAYHVSNCGLDHDNQGINSVAFVLGRYF